MVKQSRLCMIRPCDDQQDQTLQTQLAPKVRLDNLDAPFITNKFLCFSLIRCQEHKNTLANR